MLAMAVLPLLIGMVLGVGVVAPELEAGTAPSAWVLARSRARWLRGRMLPSLVAATAVLALLAVASQILWLAREPYLPNPWLSFDDASLHGPILVAKGLAAYGVALLVGALLGRTLPAVILATAVIWICLAGTGTVARSLWMQAEAPNHVVAVDPNGDVLAFPGGDIRGGGWLTADGRRISDEEAWGMVPVGEADPDAWLASRLEYVYFGVPGDLFPAWDAAETAGYGAVGVRGRRRGVHGCAQAAAIRLAARGPGHPSARQSLAPIASVGSTSSLPVRGVDRLETPTGRRHLIVGP